MKAGHSASDVAVDLDNLLYRGGLEKAGGDALLDAEDDSAAGCDADGSGSELDGFKGIFDLEEAAFWGEGAVEGVRYGSPDYI